MQKQLLQDKYEFIRSLGKGGNGETFLARHVQLNVLRAIKCIRKDNFLAGRYLSQEVRILKGLKHGGIPIIYDLEETEDLSAYCPEQNDSLRGPFTCIIMEYIEGQSLDQYLAEHPNLSLETVIQFAIQLCDIVCYLHSRKPEPIIHLDLQPRNVIINGNEVYLVDFGNALSKANEICRYGTHGFAAPEQYPGAFGGSMPVSVATDLYSFGKLLYYAITREVLYSTGVISGFCYEKVLRVTVGDTKVVEELSVVISKCLYPIPTMRFQDAKELRSALERILDDFTGAHAGDWEEQGDKIFTIALCGASSGIGVTHIGFALTGALNRRRRSALYVEHHDQAIYRLQETDNCVRERNGVYQKGHCCMLPGLGGVEGLEPPAFQMRIEDFGVCTTQTVREISRKADVCLLVSGMQPWERSQFREVLTMLPSNTISLLNFGNAALFQSLRYDCVRKGIRRKMLRVPFMADPFSLDRAGEEFLSALIGVINTYLEKGK